MRWILLAGLWALYASFGLVATSLAPLVPLIVADLGMSHTAMGSVMGAWQLVYIFSAIPCGMLLDRLGGRVALVIGIVLIALSTLGRSFADDYPTLLLAVMLFGLGGPIVSAGAPKVVTEWFEGASRGLAMGIYMTGPAIGGVVSLTLTHSVLLPAFDGDWRAVLRLWAWVSMAAAVFWFAVSSLPGARREQPVEAAPLPQLEVMKSLLRLRSVQLLLVMSVGVFLFNHGLMNWLPKLLVSGGMNVVQAGYWAAIPTVVGIAGSLIIPRLATPGRRFQILFGLCVAAALASLLLQTTQSAPLFTGLLLQGIARSALMTVLILTLVELPEIGDRRAGTASGMFFSAAEVGGVLGPLGLGLMYDWHGGFTSGLGTLTVVMLAMCVGVVALARLARSTRPATH